MPDLSPLFKKLENDLMSIPAVNGPSPHLGLGVEATKCPPYINALGQTVQNYAFAYGPHAGKLCDCPECVKLNDEYESSENYRTLRSKIQASALEQADNLVRYLRPHTATPDYVSKGMMTLVYEAIVNCALRQVADYQKDAMANFRKVQLAHRSQIQQLRNQLASGAKDAPARKVPDQDGRVFLEEPQG